MKSKLNADEIHAGGRTKVIRSNALGFALNALTLATTVLGFEAEARFG
jgi:hypothetical protein